MENVKQMKLLNKSPSQKNLPQIQRHQLEEACLMTHSRQEENL
jgi:hypothetical protein